MKKESLSTKVRELTEKEKKTNEKKERLEWSKFLESTGADFLDGTSSASLYADAPKTLCTVGSNEPLLKAFKEMTEKNILSLPVRDTKRGRFTKFIDVLDIVLYVLNKVDEFVESDGDIETALNKDGVTVGEVAGCSARNQFQPVDEKTTLHKILENVVRYEVHRIPVVDTDGNLTTVFTQSMLTKLLYDNIDEFSTLRFKTLKELKLGFREVKTININKRAIDAFRELAAQNVSALAVVNDENKIIDNISLSDFKIIGIKGHLIDSLFLPLDKYIELKHSKSSKEPIVLFSDSTMEVAMATLVENKVHRAYIVDEEKTPIGVITGAEIIKGLLLHK